MKVTHIGEIRDTQGRTRINYYRQEDGHFFALRVDLAAQHRGEADFLTEHRDMDLAQLTDLLIPLMPA